MTPAINPHYRCPETHHSLVFEGALDPFGKPMEGVFRSTDGNNTYPVKSGIPIALDIMGVSPEAKELASRAREASGKSMYRWLDDAIRTAA